jgi:hypothetical protein
MEHRRREIMSIETKIMEEAERIRRIEDEIHPSIAASRKRSWEKIVVVHGELKGKVESKEQRSA